MRIGRHAYRVLSHLTLPDGNQRLDERLAAQPERGIGDEAAARVHGLRQRVDLSGDVNDARLALAARHARDGELDVLAQPAPRSRASPWDVELHASCGSDR